MSETRREGEGIDYRLPVFLATQRKFWQLAHPKGVPPGIYVLAYFGGWGSGKTTVGKWIAFDDMVCHAGLRVLVVRQSFAALNLTSKREFLERMVEGDPDGRNMADVLKERWNEESQTYTMVNGSSILFGGIDKVDKWGSTQFGLIWIDEASEIDSQDIPFLLSRLRQPPPRCETCKGAGCATCGSSGSAWGPDFRHRVIVTSNHVWSEHFLYKDFVGDEENPPKPRHLYVETSSYENAPENGGYLPVGYLDSLAEAGDQKMLSVLMNGEWGVIPRGQPVYTFTAKSADGIAWHARPCKFDPSRPLYLSVDPGFRFPYATFHQIQARMRWRVLREATLANSHTPQFAAHLRNLLAEHYPGAVLSCIYGDPAALDASPAGPADAGVFERVLGAPFRSLPSTEVSKRARRLVVERRLRDAANGEPGFAADPRTCRVLIQAMSGIYAYPELKSRFGHSNYDEDQGPLEIHPYVDVVHTVEYFALNHFSDRRSEGIRRSVGQAPIPRYGFR